MLTTEGLFEALNLDLPELAAVRTAVRTSDWTAAKRALARHVRERKAPR